MYKWSCKPYFWLFVTSSGTYKLGANQKKVGWKALEHLSSKAIFLTVSYAKLL